MPTAWGFANHVFGDLVWGAPLLVALVVIVVLLTRDRLDASSILTLSLPLSLLATPYAWSYDHVALAVAWGLLFARAAVADRTGAVVFVTAALVLACVLPWVLYAVSFARGEESLTALVPALTAIAAAIALRAQPRAT
jgi:hypothetical protein